MIKNPFLNCTEFEWDDGNSEKNRIHHQVTKSECEQVFFNAPLIVAKDEEHSASEKRWFVLGKTDAGRELFVVFTVRNSKIRIISARDMHKKEKGVYHEKVKRNS